MKVRFLSVLFEVKTDLMVVTWQLTGWFLQLVHVPVLFQTSSHWVSSLEVVCPPHFIALHVRSGLMDLCVLSSPGSAHLMSPWVPLTYLHHYYYLWGEAVFLLSGSGDDFRLILYIYCPSPQNSYFLSIPRSNGSLYWRMRMHFTSFGGKVWQIVFT